MDIEKNLAAIRAALPKGVRLVAVSKHHSAEDVLRAYNTGQRLFGENTVQEMTAKYELLPKDIQWHFIGHVQTNKVKYMIPYVSMIQGIDSFKALYEVNKQAVKVGRIVDCLLQVHIAAEETKFGFSPVECLGMLSAGEWRALRNVRLSGLMGMASNTDNIAQVQGEFAALRTLFSRVKELYFPAETCFTELSMGMSDDYPYAIAQGSTLVRIGSRIFGERNY